MRLSIARAAVISTSLAIAVGVGAAVASAGCSARGSGLNLMSPQEENQMGVTAYAEAKTKEKPCTDAATVAFVNRVAQRLEQVATPLEPQGAAFQWEVNVFESDTVNAWCLPGGKIAVYTGILPYCQNEGALAAVLGHEITHALKRHGGQRMTDQQIAGIAGQTLGAFLQAKGVSPTTGNLAMAAFGAGTQVGVLLPFSRGQETEADEGGLDLMAKAGYDPAEAVRFWERFAKLDSGGSIALLSDHPASADRSANLQRRQPDAQKLYQAAAEKHGIGEPVPPAFRQMKAPAAK